ncbi:MAG: peptide ABC transporter substrate-binding protein, partial [Clostridia bacterium]|nr:peptide ABC transporter substrate-binding protein [Clostridia bacterium]
MKTKKHFIILLALMMLVGILSACDTTAPEQSAQPGETDENAFDLSVSIGSEPQTIDPALNCAADGAVMLNHFFEGLMKWVDDGSGNATLAQGQAQSCEKAENEDGTVTYTFKIRDDAKWSDGQPVTADDFVYSWQRLVEPATAADYSYLLTNVKGFDEVVSGQADPDTLGVAAPDESTFEVTLTTDAE